MDQKKLQKPVAGFYRGKMQRAAARAPRMGHAGANRSSAAKGHGGGRKSRLFFFRAAGISVASAPTTVGEMNGGYMLKMM